MADKKITDFTSLTEATITAANDVLVIVDATGPETKKATVSAVVGAGLITGVGEAHIDNIEINGNAIISTDTNGNIDLTPNGSGEVNISKVDIDSGAIDNTVIGGSTPAAGTFTNLTASGTVSFSGATVSNGGSVTTVDINGGTIDGATIGGSTAGAGTFTSAVVNGSGGLGYATGSGGTVTQATSRTTGVTLNKTNGAIELVSAAGTTSCRGWCPAHRLCRAGRKVPPPKGPPARHPSGSRPVPRPAAAAAARGAPLLRLLPARFQRQSQRRPQSPRLRDPGLRRRPADRPAVCLIRPFAAVHRRPRTEHLRLRRRTRRTRR